MSRLRYYWVSRDHSGAGTDSSVKSKSQATVDSTSDEDSLAVGSNVELQMLHSKYDFICIIFQSNLTIINLITHNMVLSNV